MHAILYQASKRARKAEHAERVGYANQATTILETKSVRSPCVCSYKCSYTIFSRRLDDLGVLRFHQTTG